MSACSGADLRVAVGRAHRLDGGNEVLGRSSLDEMNCVLETPSQSRDGPLVRRSRQFFFLVATASPPKR